MGRLEKGQWIVEALAKPDKSGQFVRPDSSFLETISDDHPTYKPESGRYHLYVSYACPWAHRTLIFRELKLLTDVISVSVVHPDMLDNGWTFSKDFPGATGDSVNSFSYLYQVYQKSKSDCSGKVTVPVLWDKKTNTIVNNESSEVIRIFNTAFNNITGNKDDYYPEHLRSEIDEINARVYKFINNGVYKAGFAASQSAYEEAVENLFKELDSIEKILSTQSYLVGETLTEADWRLFTTLLRFEPVYAGHFKCNIKPLTEYRNIIKYGNNLLNYPGVPSTYQLNHIKRHYYFSQRNVNPTGIVALGPREDLLSLSIGK